MDSKALSHARYCVREDLELNVNWATPAYKRRKKKDISSSHMIIDRKITIVIPKNSYSESKNLKKEK